MDYELGEKSPFFRRFSEDVGCTILHATPLLNQLASMSSSVTLWSTLLEHIPRHPSLIPVRCLSVIEWVFTNSIGLWCPSWRIPCRNHASRELMMFDTGHFRHDIICLADAVEGMAEHNLTYRFPMCHGRYYFEYLCVFTH